jgi:hypothetical protein
MFRSITIVVAEDALGPLHALAMMLHRKHGLLAHSIDILSACSYGELLCHQRQYRATVMQVQTK